MPGRIQKHAGSSVDLTRAVEVVLSSRTLKEAAKAFGVSDRTVSQWLLRPEFRAEIELVRESARETAKLRIHGLANKAVDTLTDVMEGKGRKETASARVKAAVAVLNRVGIPEAKASLIVHERGGYREMSPRVQDMSDDEVTAALSAPE